MDSAFDIHVMISMYARDAYIVSLLYAIYIKYLYLKIEKSKYIFKMFRYLCMQGKTQAENKKLGMSVIFEQVTVLCLNNLSAGRRGNKRGLK